MIRKLLGETRSKTLQAIDAKALEQVREDWIEGRRTRRWDEPEDRDRRRVPFLWRRIGRSGAGGA